MSSSSSSRAAAATITVYADSDLNLTVTRARLHSPALATQHRPVAARHSRVGLVTRTAPTPRRAAPRRGEAANDS